MKKYVSLILVLFFLTSCEQATTKTKVTEERTSKADTLKKAGFAESNPNNGATRKTNSTDDAATAIQHYKNGVDLYEKGDINGAIEQFKLSINNYSGNHQASHYLGRIYFELNQTGLALSYYEDAIGYDPNDSLSMMGMGQIYAGMGDFTTAKMYYDKTIKIAPNFSVVYYNRGTLYGMNKFYNSALQDLDQSIKLDNTNAMAYLNRGLVHYHMKETEKACEDWQTASNMGLAKGDEAINAYCK